jgi:hypothetical protein
MINVKREMTGMPEDTGNIKVSLPGFHAKVAGLINSLRAPGTPDTLVPHEDNQPTTRNQRYSTSAVGGGCASVLLSTRWSTAPPGAFITP